MSDSDEYDIDSDEVEILNDNVIVDSVSFDNTDNNDVYSNVLNLMSRSDNYNKTYWANKTKHVIALVNDTRPTDLQKWHLWVDFNKKMSEVQVGDSGKNLYQFEDDAVIQSESEYALARHEVFSGQQKYSILTEVKQYTDLCPIESTQGRVVSDHNVDCYRHAHTEDQDLEVHRLLGPQPWQLHGPTNAYQGDRVDHKGWCLPGRAQESVEFDADTYMTNLVKMESGDDVYIAINNKTRKKGTVSKIDDSYIYISIGTKVIRYDIAHVERNQFMIYPASTKANASMTKSTFWTINCEQNVLIKGTNQAPCALTGDDILEMTGPIDYHELHLLYPDIDNAVYNQNSWTKCQGEKTKTTKSSKPTKSKANTKTMTKSKFTPSNWMTKTSPAAVIDCTMTRVAELNATNMDDVVFLKHVMELKEKTLKPAKPSKPSKPSKPAKSTLSDKKTLTFMSVAEMLNDKIKTFSKTARAYLVMSPVTFRLKKKEFPLRYRVYSLKHVQHDDVIVWEKDQDVSSQFPASFTKSQPDPDYIISDPASYIKSALRFNNTFYKPAHKSLSFELAKPYGDFQGMAEYEKAEFVLDFGWKGEDAVAEQDDEEDDKDEPQLTQDIKRLAYMANVKLDEQRIDFICKLIKQPINSRNKRLDDIVSVLICFSMFIIFAQCSFPSLIVQRVSAQDIQSVPLVVGSYKLIDDMAQKMIRYLDNTRMTNSRITVESLNKFKSKPRDIFTAQIARILDMKPILKVHLDAARKQVEKAVGVKKTATLTLIPMWKPVSQQGKYVNALINMQSNIANINIVDHGKQGTRDILPRKIVMTNLFKPKTSTRASTNWDFEGIIKPNSDNTITLTEDMTNSVTLEYQIGIILENNAYYKNDGLLEQLYNGSKNEDGWNELSKRNKQVCGQSIMLKDLYEKLTKQQVSNDILIEFIVYDIKDMLGKYAHGKQSNNAMFKHHELYSIFARKNIDTTKIKELLLVQMLTFESFKIWPNDNTDLQIFLINILLSVVWGMECIMLHTDIEPPVQFETNLTDASTYLINSFNKKLEINLTNIAIARTNYESIRENRKNDIMDYYRNHLDTDGQRLIKNAVKSKLLDIDQLMMQKIMDNMNEGYDSKGEED